MTRSTKRLPCLAIGAEAGLAPGQSGRPHSGDANFRWILPPQLDLTPPSPPSKAGAGPRYTHRVLPGPRSGPYRYRRPAALPWHPHPHLPLRPALRQSGQELPVGSRTARAGASPGAAAGILSGTGGRAATRRPRSGPAGKAALRSGLGPAQRPASSPAAKAYSVQSSTSLLDHLPGKSLAIDELVPAAGHYPNRTKICKHQHIQVSPSKTRAEDLVDRSRARATRTRTHRSQECACGNQPIRIDRQRVLGAKQGTFAKAHECEVLLNP